MERPHLRNIGINEFVNWQKEEKLLLSPKFQRRKVWPPKARAFLIDTVIRGLPIPKLYMRQHLDLKTTKTVHEVVDGQQRISAVLDFHSNRISLPADSDLHPRCRYSDLPEDVKKSFLKYEFSVDLLIDAADADVLDIFARINSYSVPLNSQEKRNARFFGSFKKSVYSLGLEHLEFWKQHGILSDRLITRMREAELTSELVIGMVAGLQDKKGALDKYYEKWDDRFPYRQKVITRYRDIIDLIERYLGRSLKHTRFRRPALFYSLFLAIYELRYGAIGTVSGSKKSISDTQGARICSAVVRLGKILESSEPPKGYFKFYSACQRQTDNIQPRRTRHQTLVSEFQKQ
jgi:hypothetical protein